MNESGMTGLEVSVYEQVGGDAAFRHLVDAFYARVEIDPLLKPMFSGDLEQSKHWQFLFLTQFFGGPPRYSAERGHPRLRLRHMPFTISQVVRDHWFAHICAAIDDAGIPEPASSIMRDYFERASTFMINAEAKADNIMQWQSEQSHE
jgi:hemoglobin